MCVCVCLCVCVCVFVCVCVCGPDVCASACVRACARARFCFVLDGQEKGERNTALLFFFANSDWIERNALIDPFTSFPLLV